MVEVRVVNIASIWFICFSPVLLHNIIFVIQNVLGGNMVYLDNASTTHRKPWSVVMSSIIAMTIDSVNPGRSGYRLSLRSENKILDTRENIRKYFNTDKVSDVIFTSGATMSINMALLGTKRVGGHIVATIYEHNSVLRTLEYLKREYNIDYTLVKPRADGIVYDTDIDRVVKDNTYLIVVNHTSNVVGYTMDIESIGKVAKRHKTLFMVDGAQSVGHKTIDMKRCNINMLVVAGHKGLYATQGIGLLVLRRVEVKPLIYGGTGTHSDSVVQPYDRPEGLESGTHNLVGIYSINAGLRFVMKNETKINDKIARLSQILLEGLKDIGGVKVYSSSPTSGVIGFNIRDLDSTLVSDTLADKYDIATRSGLHCAPMVHEHYGTIRQGMVRVSISFYNKKSDIIRLLRAVKSIAKE